jgi:hypothetical protein
MRLIFLRIVKIGDRVPAIHVPNITGGKTGNFVFVPLKLIENSVNAGIRQFLHRD